MPVAILAAIAVVILIIVVVVVRRRRRPPDTVASFRRQIDALSPEARRGVVDQVQRIEHDDSVVHPQAVDPKAGDPKAVDPEPEGGTDGT